MNEKLIPAGDARVKPLQGLAPWVGGKRQLAKRLIRRFEMFPHHCYAEPFIGMGGVFLRRPTRAAVEAINDWSEDVTTLFRVVQRHPDALIQELTWRIGSRADFLRLADQDPAGLTDIERAARFAFLQYTAFGGKPHTRSFGRSAVCKSGWTPERIFALLRAAHDRLSGVHIERLPYDRFIALYDRPNTLFYLDPPYWGCEDYYGRNLFERADFERLAMILRGLKGAFVLSINDTPEIRELFAWAQIDEEALTYTVNEAGPTRVTELVISTRR
ncbi:MAG TPA: DNA adenine methylase [Azospirillaceae bacterium]|nr:DNA adenine methylase [Azospirillaceae bacterium]